MYNRVVARFTYEAYLGITHGIVVLLGVSYSSVVEIEYSNELRGNCVFWDLLFYAIHHVFLQ